MHIARQIPGINKRYILAAGGWAALGSQECPQMERKIRRSTPAKNPIKSVVRALQAMDAIGSFEDGINVTKLSKELKMGKSTVHRLLGTLLEHDVVHLDPNTSRYSLGSKIVGWNGMLLRQNLLVRCGLPILRDLADSCHQICNLAILDGVHIVIVAQYESQTRGLRLTKEVGSRQFAHSTSLGKALLTTLAEAELSNLYPNENLERVTENTITSREGLKEHLRQVRTEGVAYDFEENVLGVACLGTVVRDCVGLPIGAISISSPVTYVRGGSLSTLKNQLLDAAHRLSIELGYKSPSSPFSSFDKAPVDELAPNMLDLMAGKFS